MVLQLSSFFEGRKATVHRLVEEALVSFSFPRNTFQKLKPAGTALYLKPRETTTAKVHEFI